MEEKIRLAVFGQKRLSREGGIEIVVKELCTRMAQNGCDITCYNRAGHHVSGAEYDKTIEYAGIRQKVVPTIEKKGLAAVSSSFFAALCSAFGRYDVVHIHAEGPAFFCWIPKLFGKRVICTIHGLDWDREKWRGSVASKFIRGGEKNAVKYADEIIVLSKDVQKYFLETYGRETHFIPNGVNRPEVREAKLITDHFGLEKDSYILFLGRLVPEKGIRYLVEAFKNVKTDKKLVIAGGSSDTDSFMEELKELAKGDNRILFTGFVQGAMLDELYSNAYIYTLPSDLEGMPLSLLEAMSYGNCCLVSDIPECTEVVTFKYRLQKNKEINAMSIVNLENKTILVTGAAGFIGSNLVKRIYQEAPSATVIGIDNMNAYYDVALKEFRLNELAKYPTFTFVKGNIADKELITELFEKYKPFVVVNLAAQAGVRYSITNPDAYVESNLVGFFNILEACRHCESLEHLVYASSSSVYGSNKKVPYSTDDKVDNPVSLYAATKKSNELMAHAYSKLYNIPSTGLRFFTVYGPAGRPDMAYFGFTNKLVKGETIKIFNYGNCKRDFTYVDDIVEGVVRVMKKAPDKKNGEDGLPIPPYAVYNIGNQNPENLLDFVQILSEELVRAKVLPEDYDFEAHKELVPMQPGDVPVTYADTSALERDFGYKPSTSLREGLRKFAEWYAKFYK